MNISILTLFPELYHSFLATSLMQRAQETGTVSLELVNLFSLCAPKKRVDAPTYGPGAGMLIRPAVIEAAFDQQDTVHGNAYKVFFSPQGKTLDQRGVRQLAERLQKQKHVALFASRYEGVDTRVERYYADEVISIGDYVLMGGDLPVMVLLEAMLRLIPGVVGKQESVLAESFSGPFLDYPVYTEPLEWKGMQVPEIVRSGNHAAIAQWRQEEAVRATVLSNFNWLRSHALTPEQKNQTERAMPSHYVALMHSDVLLPDRRIGTTSTTSFDIHDIARSAKTYGLKGHFIVTPLQDQQKIVQRLLAFWHGDVGKEYNPQRAQAVDLVRLCSGLQEVIQEITVREGKPPLLIATSAREHEHGHVISYGDQDEVWQHSRPVLFVLGTGCGLAPTVLERCDYLLGPVYGFSDFNHLSVRSAAAIMFDRWLGVHPKH